MTYEQFLESKRRAIHAGGFEVDQDQLSKVLYPFQKFIVQKALIKGRYAIFSECGTGKTPMQVEWARWVVSKTNMPVLILTPLAVAAQTIEKSRDLLGLNVVRFGRGESEDGLYISNYEQIENIDTSLFAGVVLDESSILKNFTGATKKKLIDGFKNTQYKLCCTATPSPNDDMEICNHAEFLGYEKRTIILATYFTHDGGETSKWRLKGHAQKPFWDFVKSWSVTCSNPSDLGFDGSAFVLPKLNLIERVIEVPIKQGKLFNDVSVSATNFNQELRITLIERMEEVADIVNASKESFIVWVRQNKEADYLSDKLNDFREVRGDDSMDSKEENLIGFANDEFRVLVTKTKIACFGLNYQNCHNQVFASLDFSFEQLYQAIRRSYRFGQKHPVNIWLITTDTMSNVIAAIKEKQEQYENMKYHLTLN